MTISYGMNVSAVCVMIDIRGFTPLTTLIHSARLTDFLNSVQKECFTKIDWIDFDVRKNWEQKSIQKFCDCRDKLINYYSVESSIFPYSFNNYLVLDKIFPIATYYQILGDGILFVFEVGTPMESQSILLPDELCNLLGLEKKEITRIETQTKTDLIKMVVEWVTELSRWHPLDEWDNAAGANRRLNEARLGIGVSYGTLLRHISSDPFNQNKFNWNYIGDPINRAARLENNAKPGGAVFDVSVSLFKNIIKETWLNKAKTDAYETEQAYFFAQFPNEEELKGIGKIPVWACGDVGRELLYSADKLESSPSPQRYALLNLPEPLKEFLIPEAIFDEIILDYEKENLGFLIVNPKHKELIINHTANGTTENGYHKLILKILGHECFSQWQANMLAIKRRDPNLFEGDVVRLESYEDNHISVSNSGYFWAAGFQFSYDKKATTSPFSSHELIEKPFDFRNGYGEKNKKNRGDLSKSVLGNHIGINLLFYKHHKTEEENTVSIILQLRSKDNLVEKGKLCPTASGTLVPDDILFKNDAFLQGAMRELERETGIKEKGLNKDKCDFLGITREFARIGQPDVFYAYEFDKINDIKYIQGLQKATKDPSEKEEWQHIAVYTLDWNKSIFTFNNMQLINSDIDAGNVTKTYKDNKNKFYDALSVPGKIAIYLLYRLKHYNK